MKMTLEVPTEKGDKVVGLSRSENVKFWTDEDAFNSRYIRIMNGYLALTCLAFDAQLFMVSVDVDWVVYLAFQALNVLNVSYYFWTFLHGIYTGAYNHFWWSRKFDVSKQEESTNGHV